MTAMTSPNLPAPFRFLQTMLSMISLSSFTSVAERVRPGVYRTGNLAVRPVALIALYSGLLSGILGGMATHADDPKGKSQPAKLNYEDDVKPIFRAHCLNCHHQGDKRGGLALDTFTSVLEGGGSGEVVYQDGDVEGSRLWQLVSHQDTPVMPPGQPKLEQKKLDVIRKWIEAGALENSGSKANLPKRTSLAFEASTAGKPDGPPPMPESLPQRVPVVTSRAAAISALAASPWAPLAAVAGQQQVSLYHTDDGRLLGVLPFEEGVPQSIRFSRNGRYMVVGGGQHSALGIAAIYDIRDGSRMATVGDELDIVFDADATPSMKRIALGGPQRMLRIFDVGTGERIFDIKKHTDWIFAVTYSPDGVLLASGDRSGGLYIWEAETGRLFLDLSEHKGAVNSLAWRDDSNVLASASDDGTVKLWDLKEGKTIKTISAHGPGATAVRWDHKGRLVTGGRDGQVRVWDSSGNAVAQWKASDEAVLEVAFTHEGRHAMHGDWNGIVQATLIEDRKQAVPLPANPPSAQERLAAFQPTIDEFEKRLAPFRQAQAKAQAALNEASRKVDQASSRLKDSEKKLQQTRSRIDQMIKRQTERRGRIDQLVVQSRAQHDRLIAARLSLHDLANSADQAGKDELSAEKIGVKSAADAKVEKIAADELKLADQLQKLAELRRQRLDGTKETAQVQSEYQAMENERGSLKKSLSKLQADMQARKTELDRAKDAAGKLRPKWEALVKQRDQLLAAIESERGENR